MTEGQRKQIFSTYPWIRPMWRSRADSITPGLSAGRHVQAVVGAARRYPLLVLSGFDRSDMIAAGVIARFRRPPKILVLDPTWKRESLTDQIATRGAVRSLDGPHVTFGVLSRFEVATFPRTWGVDGDRVRFVPWHPDLSDDEMARPVGSNGTFFAGGNSLRDYETLLRAAPQVDAPITIGSQHLTPATTDHLPPNVTAGPLSRDRYDELERNATAVVLALAVRPDRSSGQGTLLNSMAHGKLVIVNDAPGIIDYVHDHETALVVESRNPTALANAMNWVLEHPDEAERIGRRAKEDVMVRFGPEAYLQRVLTLGDELLGVS